MIVCRDVLLADSYATAWANRVRTEEDTGSVVERACRVPEILGAMAVKGDRLAVGGTFELRLFGDPGIFKKSFRLTISRQTPPFRFPSVANYARKDDTLRSIRM